MKSWKTEAQLKQLLADFEMERGEDWIMLAAVSTGIREELGLSDDQQVKDYSLELVRMMLERGFRAGQFRHYGDTDFIPWPDQSPEVVLGRIDREWDAAKGDPGINDICWFE